jgi:hypothetical protein
VLEANTNNLFLTDKSGQWTRQAEHELLAQEDMDKKGTDTNRLLMKMEAISFRQKPKLGEEIRL